MVRALTQAITQGSCIGGRLKPTTLGTRSSACAVKLPPLAFGSLWSNSDGESVLEAREYARHALALRASAPQKSPRAMACVSAVPATSACGGKRSGASGIAAKEPLSVGEQFVQTRLACGQSWQTKCLQGKVAAFRRPNTLSGSNRDKVQAVATAGFFSWVPFGIAWTGIALQFFAPSHE